MREVPLSRLDLQAPERAASSPLVTVILVTWNGEKFLRAHLPSLLGIDYPAFEVIVVDNGSTDGSVTFLRTTYPAVRVIVNPTNLGTAEGSNVAIPRARGRYIFWVSNDMEFDRDILKHLVRRCEADEGIGICTVKMLRIKDGKPVQEIDSVGANADVFGFPDSRGINQTDRGQFDEFREVFFSFGGAMFIRKSVLEITGGFDPDYLTLADDIDLSWRVRLAGFKVKVEPKAFLYHRVSATLSKSHNRPQKRCLSERNTLRTLLKNYSAGYLSFILPLYALILGGEMLFFALLGKWEMSRAGWRALFWNISHLGATLEMRRKAQKPRRVPDRAIVAMMLKRSEKLRLLWDFIFRRGLGDWDSYFS
jgi:hypothetical protein